MKITEAWVEQWRKSILDCNCFYEGQHEEINHLCDLALRGLVAPEVAFVEGKKSHPLYAPSITQALPTDKHMYIWHMGLCYYFPPAPQASPEPQNDERNP